MIPSAGVLPAPLFILLLPRISAAIGVFHGMGVAAFMTSAVIVVSETVPRKGWPMRRNIFTVNAALPLALIEATREGISSFSEQMIFGGGCSGE